MKLEKLSLVIVPYWLEGAVQANGLKKDALVDMFALSRIVSIKDLCFYHAINEQLLDKIHQPIVETFNRHWLNDSTGRLSTTQRNGEKPTIEQLREVCEKISVSMGNNVAGLSSLYPSCDSLVSVLPHKNAGEKEIEKFEENYIFELFEIREDIVGIRFKRAETDIPYEQQMYDCYSKALEYLHIYENQYSVARTPMFNEFVRLCGQTPLTY